MSDRAHRVRLIRALSAQFGDAGAQILAPLTHYDRLHGGDLVGTLATYLLLGGNASQTAVELYLHRSGLLYRLRRIEDLLGVQLNDFQDRVALEIALFATGHLEVTE